MTLKLIISLSIFFVLYFIKMIIHVNIVQQIDTKYSFITQRSECKSMANMLVFDILYVILYLLNVKEILPHLTGIVIAFLTILNAISAIMFIPKTQSFVEEFMSSTDERARALSNTVSNGLIANMVFVLIHASILVIFSLTLTL